MSNTRKPQKGLNQEVHLYQQVQRTCVLTIMVGWAILMILVLGQSYRENTKELENKRRSILDFSAVSLGFPVWNFDSDGIGSIAEAVMKDRDILSFEVVDAQGSPLLKKEVSHLPPSEEALMGEAPILHSGQTVGFIRISLSRDWIQSNMKTQAVWITLIGLLLLVGIISVLSLSLKIKIDRLESQQLIVTNSSRLASIGEMSTGVAHEINNPLAIIMGKASLLQRQFAEGKLDPERVKQDIDKILLMASRIGKIVKGMRAFGRDSSSDPVSATPLDSTLDIALDMIHAKIKNQNITLEIEKKSANLFVMTREMELAQVIVNLLNNAADATESLKEKWIRLSIEDTEEFVLIAVTDSGKGIPPEIHEKMMQPFFSTKGVGKGTGLGLSISKGLIESHGGKLEYDAKCPNTRFVIYLEKATAKPIKAAA